MRRFSLTNEVCSNTGNWSWMLLLQTLKRWGLIYFSVSSLLILQTGTCLNLQMSKPQLFFCHFESPDLTCQQRCYSSSTKYGHGQMIPNEMIISPTVLWFSWSLRNSFVIKLSFFLTVFTVEIDNSHNNMPQQLVHRIRKYKFTCKETVLPLQVAFSICTSKKNITSVITPTGDDSAHMHTLLQGIKL